MVILLEDRVAIFSTINGESLWKKRIECQEMNPLLTGFLVPEKREHTLFMTKDIIGCFCTMQDGNAKQAALLVFDTETGDHLTTKEIPLAEAKKHYYQEWKTHVAKGQFICYTRYMSFFVYKVEGREAKKYEFCFPTEHFVNTKELSSSDRYDFVKLLGFVAKTYILVGNLYTETTVKMFYLDFRAACEAKTSKDVDHAFSIPACIDSWGSPEDEFKPVYRTDRDVGCVELVGAMREKIDSSRASDDNTLTIQTGFFVTEMQCPSQI